MYNADVSRVVLILAAVMHAEGFWIPGSRPRRNHNPVDMLSTDGTNTEYPTIVEGVDAGLHQWVLMLGGRSHVYSIAMTWRQVAHTWTGGDNADAWCESVCDDLGVDPESTLRDFIGDPPDVTLTPDPAPAIT